MEVVVHPKKTAKAVPGLKRSGGYPDEPWDSDPFFFIGPVLEIARWQKEGPRRPGQGIILLIERIENRYRPDLPYCMERFLVLLVIIFSVSAQAKTLRVSGVEGGPHIIYNSQTNRPDGLIPKFMDLYVAPGLIKKFGFIIGWHQASTARLLRELESGKIDLLCCLAKTPEREKIFSFGKEAFLSGQPSMIVRKNFIRGNKVSDLKVFKNKTIATMSGVLLPDFITENNVHVYPLAGFNISDRTLELLESGRVDGIYLRFQQIAEFIIESHLSQETLKVVALPEKPFKIYVTFRKNIPPDLKEYIEQAFADHRKDYVEMMKK